MALDYSRLYGSPSDRPNDKPKQGPKDPGHHHREHHARDRHEPREHARDDRQVHAEREHAPREPSPREHDRHERREHESREHDRHEPREHAPRDHAPREHAPRDHAPREHAPRDHAPREHAPRERHERREHGDERDGRRGRRGRRGRGGRGRDESAREHAPREHAPREQGEREPRDAPSAEPAHEPEPQGEGPFGGAFATFALSSPLLKALTTLGWAEPTEIQKRVIPVALEGRDAVGQARTGTGKTAAFGLPILERLLTRAAEAKQGRDPGALVLAPTRELALQVAGEMSKLGRYTRVRVVPVYGGTGMDAQLRALRAGADVIVGTPGRVMDHVRRGTLRLGGIEMFVLDEADRMFDLGFRDDIYWVARRLPDKRQTLLLSATMPDEVLRLAKQVTAEPELIYTAVEDVTVDTIEQSYVAVDHERKLDLLAALVEKLNPEKGIVFTRTKRGADRVASRLRDRSVDAAEIHGDLPQKKREKILDQFRRGDLHVLVATDVAARGLDIEKVSHIFNFDIPENPEDYVHRIGRTARMGREGRAITFVTKEDGPSLTAIEKLINKDIPREEIEGVRVEATDEERGLAVADHPLASQLSPALLAILQNVKRGGGRKGGGGGRPGGGRPGGGRGRPGGGRGGPRRR